MDVRVYSFRTTIPQGSWQWTNNEITPFKLVYTFDFFNYAGIHRPVWLYTKPKEISVKDVTVFAQSINVENHSAVLKYHVEVEASHQPGTTCVIQGAFKCFLKLFFLLQSRKVSRLQYKHCWKSNFSKSRIFSIFLSCKESYGNLNVIAFFYYFESFLIFFVL